METEQLILIWQLMFWLGLLASSPFLYKLSRTATKVFLIHCFPKRHVTIRYTRQDGKTLECEVDLKDETPLVEQIKRAANEQ